MFKFELKSTINYITQKFISDVLIKILIFLIITVSKEFVKDFNEFSSMIFAKKF